LFAQVVFSLSFSPDGQRIAAAGLDDGVPACVVKVLDVQTGESVFEHRESQEIFATAFSPDGRWLALGLADGSVNLADADTGNEVTSVGKHDRPIAYGSLRFRPDGLRLASASTDGAARIWDLTLAGSVAHQVEATAAPPQVDHLCCQIPSGEPGAAFWSVSFSPDGRRLITGDKDGRFTLWDAETGEELDKNTEASRSAFLAAAYSPNGRWIVSAGEDCTARVYDARRLELVHTFRGHLGPIHCLAVSDEFLVTGGRDKTVKVWGLRQVEHVGKDRGGLIG
jgi:WD40 repeat protein